jgi:hypothetical protein
MPPKPFADLHLGANAGWSPAPNAAPAALQSSLIVTAKFNDIDPQAWLADVLARIGALLPNMNVCNHF